MDAIEKGKNVIKKACIAKELYENMQFDHVGATAGAQLYFTLAILEKQEQALNYLRVCNDLITPGLLQTWMPVNFKSFKYCKQRHLTISNVEALHPKIDDINALHFLLNIDVYFPPCQITTLLPESPEEDQS